MHMVTPVIDQCTALQHILTHTHIIMILESDAFTDISCQEAKLLFSLEQ